MKKLMLVLAAVALSATAMAQTTEVPMKKYSVATNSFWANWYVQAGVTSTAAYTSQEKCCNVNPFSVDRTTLGFTVAVGKWFTPVVGIRTKFDGLWAKQVNTRDDHHSFKYFNLHEDFVWNWSNCFFGYNEKRVWNLSTYVGVGYIRSWASDPCNEDISFNAGIISTWRLAKHWNIFLDVNTAWMEGSFDKLDNVDKPYYKREKFTSRHWDKLVNATLGVTYNLGKTGWEKTPDVDALIAAHKQQLDDLNRSLKEQEDENARLRELLNRPAPEPKTIVKEVVKKEVVSTATSVFFNCGSAKIASRKDLVAVQELAEYAKANGSKLVVTGFADSKTGSAQLNQSLSEKRAEAVKAELVKMGVAADAIEVKAEGGVDHIAPFSYNRRATVKVQ